VTDRHRTSGNAAGVVGLAAPAAPAGVSMIQIRERDLDDRQLLELTRRVVDAVRDTPAQVVVNDRTDVAMAAGAAGVHLRADSVSAERVRAITSSGFLIGRSVHSAGEAVAATQTGADYVILGTVYATASKPADTRTVGVAAVAEASRLASVPVLAIGGVAADKVRDLAAAGAGGVAAIGLFADVPTDPHLEAALADVVAGVRRAFGGGGPAR
jgi:thiamine-phosphate diphosphorylase